MIALYAGGSSWSAVRRISRTRANSNEPQEEKRMKMRREEKTGLEIRPESRNYSEIQEKLLSSQ